MNSNGYSSSGQQQQHSTVVINSQDASVSVQKVRSFVGHIAFACVVAWCCNWLFGLIAFILAVQAKKAAVSDPEKATKLGKISLGVSAAGLVVGIVVIVSIIAVVVSNNSACNYTYSGTCYTYKTYVGSGYCSGGVQSGSYCYHN